MMACVFCKIASGEIPAQTAYRDSEVIAIHDINPQAPTHLLVFPAAHHANIGSLVQSGDRELLRRIFETASRLGQEHGDAGYRLVMNTGEAGGQTVDHVHVHVLAGRAMSWPPG